MTTTQKSESTTRGTSVRLWPGNVNRLEMLMKTWESTQSGAINIAIFACWLLLEFGSRMAKESINAAVSHYRRTYGNDRDQESG